VFASLGCRPEPATTPEPKPTPDPGGPTAAVDTVAEPPAPELDVDVEAGSDTGVTTEPDPEAGTEPDPEPKPTPAATTASSEREPLPKPIHKPGDGSCVKKFAVGEKVKNFKLPSLAGDKSISPAGYRKRVMLLNFWATWCKPCLEELPEFDRLYRKYRRHGMTLVAVTTDEEPRPVQDFVDQHKLVAKIALAGEEAAGAYNRPQFPFSFVVDGDGNIIAAFDFVNDACLGDLEQVIRESLEDLDCEPPGRRALGGSASAMARSQRDRRA
jgi:thiol-disulfide isomerase/thioredoxin